MNLDVFPLFSESPLLFILLYIVVYHTSKVIAFLYFSWWNTTIKTFRVTFSRKREGLLGLTGFTELLFIFSTYLFINTFFDIDKSF